MSDDEAASVVARDGIDILVDLGGHTANNRLGVLARKPAKVQVSWLGFNATSGMEQMDWIVADRFVAPPGDEQFYTEGVLRLEHGVYCFQTPELDIPLNQPPSTTNGVVTFGCFNSIDRYSTGTLSLWADLLSEIPDSQLILKTKAFASDGVASRFRTFFSEHGISPDRVVLESASPRNVLLAKYNDIDIALDPFPCNGATSTVEAVWMGVPFVTLSGDRYVGRIGESLANALGHPEWVAKTRQEYVQIAKVLATDAVALATYKKCLRDELMRSPICDGRRFCRELESVFAKLTRSEHKKAA
jgi:predicted O-linked N-acetylglucosamine transferase (SPINDLY family)